MNPYLFAFYAWTESTTMHVTFKKVAKNSMILRGELCISMPELLKSLISLEGNRKGKFICLLLQSLFRTYITQEPRGYHEDSPLFDLYQRDYPDSTLYNIKTGIQNLKPAIEGFDDSNKLKCHHSFYSIFFYSCEP